MSIYTQFTPTYLYIKEHSVTGMKYLGKTQNNPNTYLGSGTYWRRHIKKHGAKYVNTIWFQLFTDQETLTTTAIRMSKEFNVVKSEEWANLVEENGLDGSPKGAEHLINRIGSDNPMFGRIGNKHPMFGLYGINHPSFGKRMIGKQNPKSKAVIIFGIRYESSRLASKAIGIHHTTIGYRCRSNSSQFGDWKHE